MVILLGHLEKRRRRTLKCIYFSVLYESWGDMYSYLTKVPHFRRYTKYILLYLEWFCIVALSEMFSSLRGIGSLNATSDLFCCSKWDRKTLDRLLLYLALNTSFTLLTCRISTSLLLVFIPIVMLKELDCEVVIATIMFIQDYNIK